MVAEDIYNFSPQAHALVAALLAYIQLATVIKHSDRGSPSSFKRLCQD